MEKEQDYVVALIGNSAWEFGLAALDLKNPILILQQIRDERTLPYLLTKLRNWNGCTVLVPHSHVKKYWVQRLKHAFNDNVVLVARNKFSEDYAMEQIEELCSNKPVSISCLPKKKDKTTN